MPSWSEVTNEGRVHVPDPAPAELVGFPGVELAELPGTGPPGFRARSVSFGIVAVCGLTATCGIAAAALPIPPAAPLTATSLPAVWRAPLSAPPPRKLAAARPPPASTAQAVITPTVATRESGITRFRRCRDSGAVSAS